MSSPFLLCGVEGGATRSSCALFEGPAMKELSAVCDGPATNHHHSGMEEVCRRIGAMVAEAMNRAGRKEGERIRCLGLSLSGCDSEEINKRMTDTFMKMFPGKGYNYCTTTRST